MDPNVSGELLQNGNFEGGQNQGGSTHNGTDTGTHSITYRSSHVDSNIDRYRRSDINVRKRAHSTMTSQSFPWGTAVNVYKYNENAAHGKYRDFIHKHFTWAVPENALKWPSIEPTRGHRNYQPALDFINGVRHHGLKVRGHNLVWSVDRWVQDWVKQLHGDELRTVVKHHIDETMAKTCNLVEHWDVNNENLHGQFYQNQLHDPDYDLELFRMAHHACSRDKLFLNDYNVVANGYSTNDYLNQARRVKAANVGLYGLGVQCHFGANQNPDIHDVRQRLDTLAHAGLPIWATELDVQSNDENKRADYYENALTALYGHPHVEGILIWGFWDQAHWRGEAASLVKGNNLDLTAAGRRVLDLWENRWKTDETHNLSHGDRFTVRGFHGKYEVHVMYQGHEKSKQTFTLGKGSHDVNIHVQ
nr:hypothetical protein BaRGS_026273 [Batillaria attramentaria]